MVNHASREYEFVPRVINPLRMKRALFFAADAHVRESRSVLGEKMPWLQTYVLPNPESVVFSASDEPSVFLFDDTGLTFVDTKKLRAENSNSIIVLLSFQPFVQCAPPQAASQKYPYTALADLVFAADRQEFPPETIILSAVRAAEDLLNIKKHSKLRRFIFHIVDDEPRWFSEFLPVLYAIIGQRADVMITRTYEESLRFLFGIEDESRIGDAGRSFHGHGDDVVCLIADIFFPKGTELQKNAGGDLIRLVSKRYPRIPVIVASKAKEAHRFQKLGFLLPKGDPGSLEKLKDYILDFTGMGDFLVSDDEGRELRRARNIREICGILLEAEKETQEARRLRRILEDYGDKDKFSTWLYMHSYQELGDRLRPRKSQGRKLITLLKRNLEVEIGRLDRTPLSIAGKKVLCLSDLLATLRLLSSEEIQPYSDNDCFSSWLDRQGYSELAEELRPVHGSGPGLSRTLVDIIDKWMAIYRERGVPI
jgi:hypothetical protein